MAAQGWVTLSKRISAVSGSKVTECMSTFRGHIVDWHQHFCLSMRCFVPEICGVECGSLAAKIASKIYSRHYRYHHYRRLNGLFSGKLWLIISFSVFFLHCSKRVPLRTSGTVQVEHVRQTTVVRKLKETSCKRDSYIWMQILICLHISSRSGFITHVS